MNKATNTTRSEQYTVIDWVRGQQPVLFDPRTELLPEGITIRINRGRIYTPNTYIHECT
jgi:hypothetical protein